MAETLFKLVTGLTIAMLVDGEFKLGMGALAVVISVLVMRFLRNRIPGLQQPPKTLTGHSRLPDVGRAGQ